MCRQYADFQSKYIDQHHPQEKSGNGGQKDRNQRAERIREGILFDCGQNAQGNPYDRRKHKGQAAKLQRDRNLLEELVHKRLPCAV